MFDTSVYVGTGHLIWLLTLLFCYTHQYVVLGGQLCMWKS